METICINVEKNKTYETQKFFLNLSKILDLRSLNKHVAPQDLPVYYTWKNIRQKTKNIKQKQKQTNKFKIIAPTRNDDFEFLEGSYSVWDIQD